MRSDAAALPSAPPAPPVLSVRGLSVEYRTPRGVVHALDDVSFDLAQAETLGIVGESGCGKSTLARAVVRLTEPSAGSILLAGEDITGASRRHLRGVRRELQMVLQDPAASLDPRWTVGELLAEPLVIHRIGSRAERRERVADLLRKVGLPPEAAGRRPHEFSGGQRQRIGIARALALDPKLVVLDEPVSALDVSVQAQILNLLTDLQRTLGVSFLFIGHDLSVVEYISDRVAVMYLGRIVEMGDRDSLWRRPAHPYTRALLDAAPRIDAPGTASSPAGPGLAGDTPSPYDLPTGCRFHTRCPIATDLCRHEAPALRELAPCHLVACHFADDGTEPSSSARFGAGI
ncbi:peptide ABC transporter ATP-binding protein [Azospirillum thiophilum]|uniref:Peptide ABC transporter ATP-binding protein n=1 Tax=Azospirillum thiophilum TaxID=528244 RepID=A0AAC8W0S3_9PROT|nr:oligopeptide/dipeptide ABC transporter ATP-binding protein [Azospirillum thiophilum]ALG73020.1 peptide ABC transporter ATP-binding protein [Azospirillum thiophilum]KJR64065.1 peptide ABC transporter ATP-binding protein [Azospirillum thiophilum]